MRPIATAVVVAFTLCAAAAACAQKLAYPDAPKKAVTDTYYGIPVGDDYRWLEKGGDPAVKAWSLDQLKVTRAYLDALASRPKLKARFAELYNTTPVRYYAFTQSNGAFFAMKRKPPKNQPMLVSMKSAGDVGSERILLDPDVLNAKGTTAIDFYV